MSSPAHALPLDAYLDAALRGDESACLDLAEGALAHGASVRDLYLDLFQAAQRRVGDLWERNAISVGTEHRATGVTQAVIASLYERILPAHSNGRRVVMACVGGERHELGARMVADFLEMAGYDVTFLGACPPDELLLTVRSLSPEAVGIAATLPAHLPRLRGTVQGLRDALGAACPTIFVGGRAFLVAPGAWRGVGADFFAEDAEAAVAGVQARAA